MKNRHLKTLFSLTPCSHHKDHRIDQSAEFIYTTADQKIDIDLPTIIGIIRLEIIKAVTQKADVELKPIEIDFSGIDLELDMSV